jgi:hypothetical protein
VRARQAIEGGKAGREQPKPGRKNEEKQNEKKDNGKGRVEKKEKGLREIGTIHNPDTALASPRPQLGVGAG